MRAADAQGQNVTPYEAEIDKIMARLYGLTVGDRTIIEGKKP